MQLLVPFGRSLSFRSGLSLFRRANVHDRRAPTYRSARYAGKRQAQSDRIRRGDAASFWSNRTNFRPPDLSSSRCNECSCFSMFRGRIRMFAGSTGISFSFCFHTFAVDWLCERTKYIQQAFRRCFLGKSGCCVCGAVRFVYLTHTDMWSALTLCVFPFTSGEFLKSFFPLFLWPLQKASFAHPLRIDEFSGQ